MTPTGKKISSKQKEFILNRSAITALKRNAPKYYIYCLGVDKEQAKKTAIAFLEYLNGVAENSYRKAGEALQDREKQYQEISKESESCPEKIKAAKDKFETQKRVTHYQHQAAALKAIERMNVIYETKIIEARVLHAKNKAVDRGLQDEKDIRASNSEKYNRQPIVLKLEELRVDIRIALAEANATLLATQDIRENAELFIKYQGELSDINRDYDQLLKEISKVRVSLRDAKQTVAKPANYMLPPKVVDNKVTLQPLKHIEPGAN